MRDAAWFAAEYERLDNNVEQLQMLHMDAEALTAQSRRLRAQSQELSERGRQLARRMHAQAVDSAALEREEPR